MPQSGGNAATAWRSGRISASVGRPLGDDQRIHSPPLHQLLHVAAHGRDDRRVGQSAPIDAMKGEGIIRIPQDRDLIPHLRLA